MIFTWVAQARAIFWEDHPSFGSAALKIPLWDELFAKAVAEGLSSFSGRNTRPEGPRFPQGLEGSRARAPGPREKDGTILRAALGSGDVGDRECETPGSQLHACHTSGSSALSLSCPLSCPVLAGPGAAGHGNSQVSPIPIRSSSCWKQILSFP